MIAHVAGVPVEETLLPLLSGLGAGLLVARAWVVSLVRRRAAARKGAESGAIHTGLASMRARRQPSGVRTASKW